MRSALAFLPRGAVLACLSMLEGLAMGRVPDSPDDRSELGGGQLDDGALLLVVLALGHLCFSLWRVQRHAPSWKARDVPMLSGSTKTRFQGGGGLEGVVFVTA